MDNIHWLMNMPLNVIGCSNEKIRYAHELKWKQTSQLPKICLKHVLTKRFT